MALLSTRDLGVAFGAKRAVDGFTLEVGEGQLVGLIGPNGAGKTTTIDAITGFVPSTGTVTFDGTDISGFSSTERARAGLGRTWQSSELFDDLTVMENLQVAAERIDVKGFLRDLVKPRNDDLSAMEAILDSLDLTGSAGVLPTDLSHGQRKLVGVARALAMKPQLVLLDEPAAGLDTAETAAMAERVRGLAQHGIAVLLVDHDMSLVASVCDRVVVLDLGTVIATGAPVEVLTNPAVVAAYLGATAASEAGR